MKFYESLREALVKSWYNNNKKKTRKSRRTTTNIFPSLFQRGPVDEETSQIIFKRLKKTENSK
jgi:hypothetical protein